MSNTDKLFYRMALQSKNKAIQSFRSTADSWKKKKRSLRRRDKQELTNVFKSSML